MPSAYSWHRASLNTHTPDFHSFPAFGTPRASHDISRRVASTRRRALRVRARAHAHDRFFRTDRAAARRTNAPIAVGRRFESRRAPFLSHPHACDARRTMVSLNARRNERSSSNKASEIINGFLSSPVRVFYSILFICALEVRDFVDAMRRARNHREGACRGAIDRARRETDDARACDR